MKTLGPLRVPSRRRVLFLAALILVAGIPSSPAQAQILAVSPGVKIAYSFGSGGFTMGLELSFIGVAPGTPLLVGGVLNADTNFDGRHKFRFGVELMAPFIYPAFGIEFGPSFVVHGGENYGGFGLTPWFGYGLFPFYTWTGVVDAPDSHELGGYLKAPLMVTGGDLFPWF